MTKHCYLRINMMQNVILHLRHTYIYTLLFSLSSLFSTMVWADETIFSAVPTVTEHKTLTGNTMNHPIAASDATIIGGTMEASNGHSSTEYYIVNNIKSSKDAFILTGNKTYTKISLSGGNTLAVGDVISAKLWVMEFATNGNGLWFSLSTTRPGSAPTEKAVTTDASSAWMDISYTVTAGDELAGQSEFYIFRGAGVSNGARTCYTDFLITRPCAAPNHVDVSGNWHFFPGETISLTAQAYSTAGTSNPITSGVSYQWQKFIGSAFEDIDGATSATYTKTNATAADAGQYRCIATTGTGCSTASASTKDSAFKLKCLQLYWYYDNNSDCGHIALTKVSNTIASASINLVNGNSYSYRFKVTDGCGNWYGNTGEMTSSNCTNWNLDANAYTRLTSSGAGTYTFKIDYTDLVHLIASVQYPKKQISGYPIYFEKPTSNWANAYYRVGANTTVASGAMTLVNGTARLYTTTTSEYVDFNAWHICNNTGWTGSNHIYRTYTNNDSYSITYSTNFDGTHIGVAGVTVVMKGDGSMGTTTSGDDKNDNCRFYDFDRYDGLLTHNISITPNAYGTVTVNYTSIENASLAFNSGSRDLAHTANYCVTAEVGDGYELSTITINGTPVANRSWHVLTGDVIVAATFIPATYTVTLNTNGGTINAGNVTSYTYGVGATLPTNVTKTGNYFFAGWYDNAGCTGSPVTAISTTETGDKTFWAKWREAIIVNIPGTVNKGNKDDCVPSMTWYGANDEYFDFGPTAGTNLDRWVEWKVRLLVSGEYNITEIFDVPADPKGHQWHLALLDGLGNEVDTINTTRVWIAGTTRTDAKIWDLRDVTPGVYTLRVTNFFSHAQPKLKSITLSYRVSKVPNQKLYGDPGDEMRAYGTITDSIVTTLDHMPSGAVSASGRVLTIGSETITAPETEWGKLTNIPKDCYTDPEPCSHVSSCLWRFKEWNTTELKAIYIPTFAIGYDPKGGTINDATYNTWYEYTGREEDITELPMDVTKEGYLFAGWYQDESTKELFPYITGNYYGDYSGAYGLKAHWVLPCDEQKVITGVTLTSSSTYTTDGYDSEYIGTPLVTITGSGSEPANVDGVAGDETGYELGAAGDMVFVTLGTGIFRVGDMIRVYITARNTAGISGGSRDYLELFYKTKDGDIVLLTHLKNVNAAGVYSYILPSDDVSDMTDAEAVSVGVYRKDGADGQNPCVYRVEVVGCRDLYFDDNNNSHNWSDPKNWAPTYHEIPSYYQAVRILKPCIVNIANAQAKNVELYKDAGKNYNGQLTINDTAALAVEETIRETRGTDDFETLYPVQASDLVILSTASHQGALAHGDTENKTHATVEFYARGVVDINDWEHGTWQYMGVPFNDVTDAQEHYYGAWMAQWIEDTSGDINANWTWIAQYDALTPFAGYGLTQEAAKIYTNSGTLVPSSNQTLTLTASGSDYKGWNMFANSWMAPIYITQFIAADFGAAQQTIYLFNTGHNAGNQSTFGATTAEGQYIAVPINTAGSMDASYQYIAPMQGFYIMTETATSVTLNYDRLVRKSDHSALSVGPNRAPKMKNEEPAMPRIVIDVTGNRFSDRLYIFENEEQTNGFDNGWDGYKFEGDDYAPQLMTRTDDLDLAVDVSPSFEGKRIAFRAGEDDEYTLHFSTTENGLWIRDLITTAETEIAEENTYSFFASNTTSEERFEIVDRRQTEEVTTGFSEISEYDGELIAQTVYTIDGRLVLKRTSNFNQPLRLPQTGVYLLELQTTAGTKIKKITF